MKCVNCKHCVGMYEDRYMCDLGGAIELIEECIANDDNQPCEFYVQDMDDDDQA